jgi:hypothetical protein
MTVVMPSPVPLPMPPGDAEAVADVVREVAGAAFWLALLGDRLAGPAASAPGWLGDDASAAATQVGRVAALAREATAAVLTVAGRLSTHAECLRDARRRIEELRAEQEADFRAAWRQLGRIENFQVLAATDSPEAFAIVEDVEAAEATRRRRHAALVEEVEDDAAATARVLADGCAVVGGRGRSGDADRVVAYLAAELPGWGDLELARRGRAAAEAITGGPVTPEEMEAAARSALTYAGAAPFADALLSGLGVDGVEWLLRSLGHNTLGPASDVARMLAAAFGGAAANGVPKGPVLAVLRGTYVRADDRYGTSGAVVAGMATVLAAGRSLPSGGLSTPTVAHWARQMLLWEDEQGLRAGVVPVDWGPELGDPAALALGILAERGEPGPSADLLADARVWEALLRRAWLDGGVALGEVVTHAGQEPGAAGGRAVRTGLAVIGSGLFAGDPSEWTVNRRTVVAIAPALGSGVAAHVDVVTTPLSAAADAEVDDRSGDVLRGLGYLTVDRDTAAVVERALSDWVVGRPVTPGETASPLVVVPSGYLAVQEYGQRLAHALHSYEQQEEAELSQVWWDFTVGLAVNFVPGPGGIVAGIVEGYAAILVGADGTFEVGPDRGLDFDRQDAVDEVLATLPADQRDATGLVVRQSRAAFDGVAQALGSPKPSTSPETDWLEPLLDGMADVAGERMRKTPGVEEFLPFGTRTPD